MQPIIKMVYRKEQAELSITCGSSIFDTSYIQGMSIEQWAFPFYSKGVKWKGIYEELRRFAGCDTFILRFDSDNTSYAIMKHVLEGTAVKLAGLNNVVTIIYSENPFVTKITVNGELFDTSQIQNRSIEEWIGAIHIRGMKWEGIFKEIENYIGTDICTINFVGEPRFMSMLIDACPETMDIFYRDPQIMKGMYKEKRGKNEFGDPETKTAENLTRSVQKAVENVKQNVVNGKNDSGSEKIPIKNSFVRENIMTICGILSIIVLFLPFVSFSAAATVEGMTVESQEITANAIEALFGIKEIKIGANNSIFAVFFLIVPIVVIIMNYIKPLQSLKKIIAIAAPLLGIAAEVITVIDLKALCQTFVETAGQGVELKTSLGIGFILLVLIYCLTVMTGLITYYGLELKKKKL